MELICKKEAVNEKGKKIMNFTDGVIYDFKKTEDPEGWEVLDDNRKKEVFFDPYIMFTSLQRDINRFRIKTN